MNQNKWPCRPATGGKRMIELEGVACVADLPRVQALRRGGAPALVFEGRTTTFAEVDAMASRIANALIASGVRTQERIAYLSKNTDDFLIACSAPARRASRWRRSIFASPRRRSPASSRTAARG